MRWHTIVVAAIAILVGAGCDANSQKRFGQELLRHFHIPQHGALIVTSVAGASAPVNGLGPLNALCTDQGWRLMFAHAIPNFENVPSIFEIPDPKHPTEIVRH